MDRRRGTRRTIPLPKKVARTIDKQISDIDLETLNQLENIPTTTGFGFFLLDAERNLSFTKWAQSSSSVDELTSYGQYSSEVEQIRGSVVREYPKVDLLSRSLLIEEKDIHSHKLISRTDKVKHLTTVKKDIDLPSRINLFNREIGETIEMADQQDPTAPVIHEEIEGSDDNAESIESVDDVAGGMSHEPGDLTVIPSPKSKEGDSNRALAGLLDVHQASYRTGIRQATIKEPSPARTVSGTIYGTIPRRSILSAILPYPKEAEKPVESGRATSPAPSITPDPKDLKIDTMADTLEIILKDIGEVADQNKSIKALLNTLVSAQSGIEKRIQKLEASTMMINTTLVKMESQLANILLSKPTVAAQRVTVPDPSPSTVSEAVGTESALAAEDIAELRRIYTNHIQPLRLTALTLDLYITVQQFGGFEDYFTKVYPETREVSRHAKLIDMGQGTALNFRAVDRTLTRLQSNLHKREYLAPDPQLSQYEVPLSGLPVPPELPTEAKESSDAFVARILSVRPPR